MSTSDPPVRAPDPGAPPSTRSGDPWLRFALVFSLLAVASELLYYGVALESALFQRYLVALAHISGWILTFFTDEVSVRGTFVSSRLFSVEIARGCDAYRMCALLTSAIIAFPAPWPRKAWGIALGLLWLNLLNFVRIIGLFFIGGHFFPHFRESHEIYFPIFLIAMTVLAWILWVRRAARDLFGTQTTAA